MVGATCPSCGAVNPVGAGSCVRCGRWLPTVAAAPLPPPPPPGFAPGPPTHAPPGAFLPPPWSPAPTGFTAAIDGVALDWIQLASLLSFVAGLASPILLYGVGPLLGYSPWSRVGAATAFEGNALDLLLAAALIGTLIGLVSLWLVRRGFSALRPVDSRFATPTSLIPVAMVGLLLLAVGLPLLLAGVAPLVQCTAQQANQTVPAPSNCFARTGGELAGGALLTVIGAILGLIGYIGMILGLWRLGDRYSSTILHVGAILAVFLPFVGWLLIFFGCREERRKGIVAGRGWPAYGPGHG